MSPRGHSSGHPEPWATEHSPPFSRWVDRPGGIYLPGVDEPDGTSPPERVRLPDRQRPGDPSPRARGKPLSPRGHGFGSPDRRTSGRTRAVAACWCRPYAPPSTHRLTLDALFWRRRKADRPWCTTGSRPLGTAQRGYGPVRRANSLWGPPMEHSVPPLAERARQRRTPLHAVRTPRTPIAPIGLFSEESAATSRRRQNMKRHRRRAAMALEGNRQ